MRRFVAPYRCGRQISAKRRFRPLSRDESACFRGATHVRRGCRALGPSGAGRGPRPSPGPLVEPSPGRLPRILSANGILLWCGGVGGTCSVIAVIACSWVAGASPRLTKNMPNSGSKRLGLGIDDVAPVQVAPRPTRWFPSCGDPSDFQCGRRK